MYRMVNKIMCSLEGGLNFEASGEEDYSGISKVC